MICLSSLVGGCHGTGGGGGAGAGAGGVPGLRVILIHRRVVGKTKITHISCVCACVSHAIQWLYGCMGQILNDFSSNVRPPSGRIKHHLGDPR